MYQTLFSALIKQIWNWEKSDQKEAARWGQLTLREFFQNRAKYP
jgi:hypothetical protein